jgi:hypothetical protein
LGIRALINTSERKQHHCRRRRLFAVSIESRSGRGLAVETWADNGPSRDSLLVERVLFKLLSFDVRRSTCKQGCVQLCSEEGARAWARHHAPSAWRLVVPYLVRIHFKICRIQLHKTTGSYDTCRASRPVISIKWHCY